MKLGDQYVITRSRFGRNTSIIKSEITKITKTQFTVGETRFMKSTNREVGGYGSLGRSAWVTPYDPDKHDENLQKYRMLVHRTRLWKDIEPKMTDLSLEKLQAIHDIIFDTNKEPVSQSGS